MHSHGDDIQLDHHSEVVAHYVIIEWPFRKIPQGGSKCTCAYPSLCDSQKDEKIDLNDSMAHALEKAHVHSVYENIADHFSDTRHKPWPHVLEFLSSLASPGNVLIDVG